MGLWVLLCWQWGRKVDQIGNTQHAGFNTFQQSAWCSQLPSRFLSARMSSPSRRTLLSGLSTSLTVHTLAIPSKDVGTATICDGCKWIVKLSYILNLWCAYLYLHAPVHFGECRSLTTPHDFQASGTVDRIAEPPALGAGSGSDEFQPLQIPSLPCQLALEQGSRTLVTKSLPIRVWDARHCTTIEARRYMQQKCKI